MTMKCKTEVPPIRCLGCNGELSTEGRAKVCFSCSIMYVSPIPFDADEEIGCAVALWHALDWLEEVPLHTYLGWTWEQYAAYVEGRGVRN